MALTLVRGWSKGPCIVRTPHKKEAMVTCDHRLFDSTLFMLQRTQVNFKL
jgi:hypothetical protein